MEVANQGKSVGILSAAPSSAGLNLGGSGNPDFLIAADTTNNQLESMVQIHGSTSSTGQGVLTLSTQGTDSTGNVARGDINLVADGVYLNSQSMTPRAWVLYEHPAHDLATWSSEAGKWYNNFGANPHIEGPSHTGYWERNNSTGLIVPLVRGYWYIEHVMMGYGSGRNMAGIFSKSGDEICSGSVSAHSGYGTTASAHYLFHFDESIDADNVGWYLKVAHGGNIYISRRVTYANIIYLGPTLP